MNHPDSHEYERLTGTPRHRIYYHWRTRSWCSQTLIDIGKSDPVEPSEKPLVENAKNANYTSKIEERITRIYDYLQQNGQSRLKEIAQATRIPSTTINSIIERYPYVFTRKRVSDRKGPAVYYSIKGD